MYGWVVSISQNPMIIGGVHPPSTNGVAIALETISSQSVNIVEVAIGVSAA